MMNEALVSIVVPVYNVEKYLKRCVNSIVNQSYKCLEIILVDDGSTDTSGSMCDELAESDSRICVVHKENGGLSQARNVGIQHATGEYIAFVDSDDYLDKNYVQYLYKICENYQAEVAICGLRKTSQDNEQCEQRYAVEIYTRTEALEHLLYQKKYNMSACTKLCKRILYDGVVFPEGELYEDVNTTYKIIEKAQKIGYCSNQLYFYYANPKSITQNEFHEGKMVYITHMDEVMAFVRQKYPELERAAEFRYIWANIHLWVHIPSVKQYRVSAEQIKSNIHKYRRRVLLDKKIGLKNALIILLTYGGHGFVRRIFQLIG